MRVPRPQLLRDTRALTLVEGLLVIVAMAIVVAIAVPIIGNIRESAKRTVMTQNAKMVASMSEALAALGVAHVIPDSMGGVEATARLLREGVIVPEGPFAGERFVLSGMTDGEIEDVADYLEIRYDTTGLRLIYAGPPEAAAMRIPGGSALFCHVSPVRALLGGIGRP